MISSRLLRTALAGAMSCALMAHYGALANAHMGRWAESTRSTPPSAFLHRQPKTTDELVAQLANDPGARKGYAKVFHLPAASVAPFIKSHCSQGTLQSAGKYTVYRVTSAGTIYPTVQRVPAGARIFILRGVAGGAPPYISSMGDPMIPFRTAVTVKIVRKPQATKVLTQVSPSQETLVPTQPVESVVPISALVYQAAPSSVASQAKK